MKSIILANLTKENALGVKLKVIIDDLVSIELPIIEKICDGYLGVITKCTSFETHEAKIEEASRLSINYNIYDSVFSFIKFCTQIWIDNDYKSDTSEKFVDDLVEADLLNDENKAIMRQFWDYLESKIKAELLNHVNEQTAISSGFPHLMEVEATSRLAVVFEDLYHFSSDPQNYTAVISGVKPVIDLRLKNDDENSKSFRAEATPQEIKYFINALTVALKQAEAIERTIKVV